jgi:integrase
MRRRVLSDRMIALLPRRDRRYSLADPEQVGLILRIPNAGPISFAAVTRDPFGKHVWTTLGTTATMDIATARIRTREVLARVKAGLPGIESPPPPPQSVGAVAEAWLVQYVEHNNLRTAKEQRRIVEKYILPYWRDRPFTGVKRSDSAILLDGIQTKHGPQMADAVLSTLRSISRWYEDRDDGYSVPFTRVKRRTPRDQHRRARVLDDGEIQKLWRAAEGAGQFGAFLRLALLVAQRADKLLTLQWDDIQGDDWIVRTAPREKGNPGRLVLPAAALAIIRAQPRIANNPHVFASARGDGPASLTSGRLKRIFDSKSGITEPWHVHDLRRTARSLMSRAGAEGAIAERLLGHAVGGVQGIYDRHAYTAEMGAVLERLAALIERIVNPPADNVVALHEAAS